MLISIVQVLHRTRRKQFFWWRSAQCHQPNAQPMVHPPFPSTFHLFLTSFHTMDNSTITQQSFSVFATSSLLNQSIESNNQSSIIPPSPTTITNTLTSHPSSSTPHRLIHRSSHKGEQRIVLREDTSENHGSKSTGHLIPSIQLIHPT